MMTLAPSRLRASLRRLVGRDDAMAITEYGLLVAFIALAVVGVLIIFGPQLSIWFAAKTGQITTL